MVSGIGPREVLENLGIPVVKELKGVGQNMWVRRTFLKCGTLCTDSSQTARIILHSVQLMQ